MFLNALKIETFKMRPKRRPEMDTDLALPNVPKQPFTQNSAESVVPKSVLPTLRKIQLRPHYISCDLLSGRALKSHTTARIRRKNRGKQPELYLKNFFTSNCLPLVSLAVWMPQHALLDAKFVTFDVAFYD